MMKKVKNHEKNSSPFYPTVTDREGHNDKSLSLLSLDGNRLRLMVTTTDGAGMVPWRPLQPVQAGFESPALHLFYYN